MKIKNLLKIGVGGYLLYLGITLGYDIIKTYSTERLLFFIIAITFCIVGLIVLINACSSYRKRKNDDEDDKRNSKVGK